MLFTVFCQIFIVLFRMQRESVTFSLLKCPRKSLDGARKNLVRNSTQTFPYKMSILKNQSMRIDYSLVWSKHLNDGFEVLTCSILNWSCYLSKLFWHAENKFHRSFVMPQEQNDKVFCFWKGRNIRKIVQKIWDFSTIN